MPKLHIQWKHGGKEVFLIGSFNEWTEGYKMNKETKNKARSQKTKWTYDIDLPFGEYEYKFIVDGEWFYDVENPTKTDQDGNTNNLLVVNSQKLIIVRGASGSGKSTLGKLLLEKNYGKTMAEADKFMMNDKGKYVFDPKKLSEAHAACRNEVLEAMKNQEICIVVSNTSTLYWEMYEYVLIGQKYNYTIEFHEPITSWKSNVDSLLEKNVHQVPVFSLKNQLMNLKKNPTLKYEEMIEKILATGGFRPSIFQNGFNQTPFNLVYYGINSKDLTEYTDKLKNHLGENYEVYINQKWKRDCRENEKGEIIYHVPIILPSENGKKNSNYLEKLKILESRPKFLGIGKLAEKTNFSYFIVVDWPEIHQFRKSCGLIPLDLSITLAFHENDVQIGARNSTTIFL